MIAQQYLKHRKISLPGSGDGAGVVFGAGVGAGVVSVEQMATHF